MISRFLEHNPKLFSAIEKAFEATTAALEGVVGANAERLFRAPAATWARASVPLGAFTQLLSTLTINVPDELRRDIAELVRARGPELMGQTRDEAQRMMEEALREPGKLAYLRYIYEAELAFPNVAALTVGMLVERATEPARIKNVLSSLRPPMASAESNPEQHARAVAQWVATIVQSVVYPFAVDPLVLLESIVQRKKLFKNKEGKALRQFNESVEPRNACPPFPEDFALIRNAHAHLSIDVAEDGRVTMHDEAKAERVFTASELQELGASALSDTVHILVALVAVMMWRLSREAAVEDLPERLATALAENAECNIELVSDTAALEARLDDLGMVAAD